MTSANIIIVGGSVFGFVTVCASAAFLAFLNRRRRKQRNERPPQETKLLRPAGYFLQEHLEHLDRRFEENALWLIASGGIFGTTLAAFVWMMVLAVQNHITLQQTLTLAKNSNVCFGVTAMFVSGAISIICLRKLQRIVQDMRNYHLGLRGEQAVAEALADPALAAAGYVTFHDVPGDGDWNIDHVVIGPAGVFIIETKTKSRRKATRDQQEHIVTFDGRRLQFPWGYDDKAVPQVQANAEWLQRLLCGNGARKLSVQPIIVVPGWYVQLMGTNFDVKAMNATYLVGYLLKEPARHAPEELQCARECLSNRCRTVEF